MLPSALGAVLLLWFGRDAVTRAFVRDRRRVVPIEIAEPEILLYKLQGNAMTDSAFLGNSSSENDAA